MNRCMKSFVMSVLAVALLLGVTPSWASAKAADPTLNDERFLNIAHRGVSGLAPEHTFAAYDLVKQQKGDYIEIDIQMTKDGELVAMHDTTADRTTNGTGEIRDLTLEEVQQLDAGSWFNEKYPEAAKPEFAGLKVPTLQEVFERYGKHSKYYIETKSPDVYPGMEEKLLELLEEYDLIGPTEQSSNVIIQSFSPRSLKKIHAINDRIPLVQLLSYQFNADGKLVEGKNITSAPNKVTAEELQKIDSYAVGIGMNYRIKDEIIIDKSFVDKARERDLLVHPFTVNSEEDMKLMLNLGVTGMFTNFAGKLNDVIRKH